MIAYRKDNKPSLYYSSSSEVDLHSFFLLFPTFLVAFVVFYSFGNQPGCRFAVDVGLQSSPLQRGCVGDVKNWD